MGLNCVAFTQRNESAEINSIGNSEKLRYNFEIGQSLDYLLATGFHYKYHKQIYLGFSIYKEKWKFKPEISYFHSRYSFLNDSTYFGKKLEEKDDFISIRLGKELRIKHSIFRVFFGLGSGYYSYYSLSPGLPIFTEKRGHSFTLFPYIRSSMDIWKGISFFLNFQSGIWFSHSTEKLMINGAIYLSEKKKGINFYSPNPINFGISININ